MQLTDHAQFIPADNYTRLLANADAPKVLAAIEAQGYYLQMPPLADQDMLRVRMQNTRLQ